MNAKMNKMYKHIYIESINSSFRKVTKRVLPKRKCTTLIALSQNYRALQKTERMQGTELGYG